MPNLHKPVYVAGGLSFLPPFLSPEFTARRSSAKENITEILVTEIGDSTHKAPYMIVSGTFPLRFRVDVADVKKLRSASDDLTIYQPYQSPIEGSKDTALRFLKIPNPSLPKHAARRAQMRLQPLRSLPDLGGYSAVFKPGPSPSFIIKSASSQAHELPFGVDTVRSITPLHTARCRNGFMYVDREVSHCYSTVQGFRLK